jgi:hypothetical protein
LIGLSPLPTSHPKIFQHLLVRTSTTSYCRFILDMGRSPGFTSAARNLFALFRLAFATGTSLKDLASLRTSNSLAHYAKGTLSSRHVGTPTDCKHTVSGTFNSPPGVLFTFPSRYYSTIGHKGVFSLTRWSGQIPAGFHVSRSTRVLMP